MDFEKLNRFMVKIRALDQGSPKQGIYLQATQGVPKRLELSNEFVPSEIISVTQF